MAAHSVLGVANEFITRAKAMDRRITPMHLQKLCYMTHGFSLALLDSPLTSDPIQAWDFGPVYPVLYDALKKYGSGDVSDLIAINNWAFMQHVRGSPVRANLSTEQQSLLNAVYEDYGEYQAFQLSALTHEADSPWAKVYRSGVKGLVISDEQIRNYFVTLTSEAA